jgi:hypothetical protein
MAKEENMGNREITYNEIFNSVKKIFSRASNSDVIKSIALDNNKSRQGDSPEVSEWKVKTQNDYHKARETILEKDPLIEDRTLSVIQKKWKEDITNIMRKYSRENPELAEKLQNIIDRKEKTYIEQAKNDPELNKLQNAYNNRHWYKNDIANSNALRTFELFQSFYIELRVSMNECIQKAENAKDVTVSPGSAAKPKSDRFKGPGAHIQFDPMLDLKMKNSKKSAFK